MWGPIQGKMFKLKAEELGRHPWFAHEENEDLALEVNALLLFNSPGRSVPRARHRTLEGDAGSVRTSLVRLWDALRRARKPSHVEDL